MSQDKLLEIEKFNERLKNLETFEELEKLVVDLNKSEWGLALHGKRRGYQAYHFTHLYDYEHPFEKPENNYRKNNPRFLNRVDYLYSDGASTGESYIKNLHRVLKVR